MLRCNCLSDRPSTCSSGWITGEAALSLIFFQIVNSMECSAGQKKRNSELGIFCAPPPEGGGSKLNTVDHLQSRAISSSKFTKISWFKVAFLLTSIVIWKAPSRGITRTAFFLFLLFQATFLFSPFFSSLLSLFYVYSTAPYSLFNFLYTLLQN